MLTLWLHGAVGADASAGLPAAADLLVPLAPAPPGIAPYRPHPVSELLPVMTHRLTPSSPPVPPSLAAPPPERGPGRGSAGLSRCVPRCWSILPIRPSPVGPPPNHPN